MGTICRKFLVGGISLVVATFAGMAIPWPDALDLGENAYCWS